MLKEINQLQIITWGLIAVLAAWLTLLSFRLRAVSKTRRQVEEGLKQDKDIPAVISRALGDIAELGREQKTLGEALKTQRAILATTIRRVALVRYDAFQDVGGKISFSAALLNENGDGLVISSISGRSEGRIYAKPIKNASSTYPLSEEEQEVIKQALDKRQTKDVIELEQGR